MNEAPVISAVQRAAAKAHMQSAGFRKRLGYARDAVEATYRVCAHPYVAYSAGKDSSALLHIVAMLHPTATARMLTGGETRLLFREIDGIYAWWRATFTRLDFDEILVDHVFAEGWEDATFIEQWATFHNEWAKYMHNAGAWDGVLLGLRSDESGMRRFWNAKRHTDEGYPIRRYSQNRDDAKAGVYVSAPLAYWTAKDVESYIIAHNVPVLSTYYRDGFDTRTHTRIGMRTIGFGQLAELRRRDPENYQRLIERFPELGRLT